MTMPGMWETLIIAGVIVLIFGAKKLPALGGAVGESIKNFKKGLNDAKTIEADVKNTSQSEDTSKQDQS